MATAALASLVFWPTGSGTAWTGSPEPSPRGRLEQELGRYLERRLLVFRRLGIGGPQVEFDWTGRLLGEAEGPVPSRRSGILFLNLRLAGRRLIIQGEQVLIKPQESFFVPDPHKLQLMTCVIQLPLPPEMLNLGKAVAVLRHVFLSKAEFDDLKQQ